MARSAEAGGEARTGRRGASETAVRIVFWIAAFLAIAYAVLKASKQLAPDPGHAARDFDFVAFWAGAKLAVEGHPLEIFDPEALKRAAGFPASFPMIYRWLYPPGLLVLLLPLGALDFTAAWVLFMAVSAICLALALRRPAAGLPGGWRLVLSSPCVLVGCLALGQMSVLWTAALVAALAAMRAERPVLAGFWIATLTLKPHLGLLIPVALIAARQWRVLAWAAIWSAALVVLATLPFGLVYWSKFVAAIDDLAALIRNGALLTRNMVSVSAAALALGIGDAVSLWIQLAFTIVVAGAVSWVWRRDGASWDSRCAALCAAIPLATPYSFYYDMPVTVVAGVFLARDGLGRSLAGRTWLAVLWVGPIAALYLPVLVPHPPALAGVAVTSAAMMLVTLAIGTLRAARSSGDGIASDTS